jgi:tRNA(Ile2) C34 agmatinyltransferase TiaS
MSLGAVLVGIGLLAVVVAYVARPFRVTAKRVDPQRAIELWVAQIREGQELGREAVQAEGPDVPADGINYCPECGRRVTSRDRFCSGCGTRLRGGEP